MVMAGRGIGIACSTITGAYMHLCFACINWFMRRALKITSLERSLFWLVLEAEYCIVSRQYI
jgi:hypothetical protein